MATKQGKLAAVVHDEGRPTGGGAVVVGGCGGAEWLKSAMAAHAGIVAASHGRRDVELQRAVVAHGGNGGLRWRCMHAYGRSTKPVVGVAGGNRRLVRTWRKGVRISTAALPRVHPYTPASREVTAKMVTRFQCGGFAFAVRLNHTMSDGSGLIQFLNAIAGFAQGKSGSPSVTPVWQREVLFARNPPRVTCLHNEYYEPELDLEDQSNGDGNETMISRWFFFGTKEIGALRSHLPPQKRTRFTRFEIITACIWKCRTIALGIGPNESVRISCIINGRGKAGLDIPDGYYGNVFVYPASVSKAETVSKYPLEYVVELVKKTRSQAIDGEYFMSVADLMVTRGRPLYTRKGNFIISHAAQLGFDKVDFGWGKPVYGGPAEALSLISFFSSFRDNERGDGILTAICLPGSAMQRFEDELKKMTKDALRDVNGHIPARIASKL
ncbi:alcohol acyltransferase 16-like [Diospyros lotus]|uniref:alcohol acyltransferase 16-like n=1 Tax=Diospyros lotus TaxID=55363 RepID=UPI00224F94C7|nr:alcohol acyltransferase 16-like [Diospyros lotus]